jgi:hypothetical protein
LHIDGTKEEERPRASANADPTDLPLMTRVSVVLFLILALLGSAYRLVYAQQGEEWKANYDLYVPERRRADEAAAPHVYFILEKNTGTVTLQVSEAPIRQVIRSIVEQSGQTFAISREVDQEISMSVDKMKWTDAVQELLRVSGLTLRQQGSYLIIDPGTETGSMLRAVAWGVLALVGAGVIFYIGSSVYRRRRPGGRRLTRSFTRW